MVTKDVTLRKIARHNGQRHYKSDSVCVHGHINPWRNTDNGGCRVCVREKYKTHKTPLHFDAPLKNTVSKPKPTVKKVIRKKQKPKAIAKAKACTCNSNDYRRTVKKWIKDNVAAW